jgi:hypothetical protein
MKVSTENNNNIGYEKITSLVDNMPLTRRNNDEQQSILEFSGYFG